MAIEQVTLANLKTELARTQVARGIKEVVLHHTWSPTAAQYRGQATWEAIRRYHVETNGWSDIGYHFGVAPDESIWKLRPVTLSGAHVLNRNQHTIGVAMIGNFDEEDPAKNGLTTAVKVVRLLVERFKLKPENIRFHREFQNKTCPGTKLDLREFRQMVMATGTRQILVVEHATGKVIGKLEMVEGGDHVADQGKIYVRK